MKCHSCTLSRSVVAAVSICLLLLNIPYVQAQQEDEIPQVALEDAATDDSEERVVVYPDQPEDAAVDEELAEQAQVLQLRAGEFGEGRANIMGMYTKELEPARVIVTEVGAATPAFEAGIREGDEIVSFDGFEGDSYRKWIDGMRKLANAAPEGHTLPVRVLRDGEMLDLRLRKPASGAPVRLPRDEALGQQITQQEVPQMPLPRQPAQPFRDRGGLDIVNAPFFGGAFGERLGGTTDRAMAVIFRLAAPQPPVQPDLGDVDRTRARAGTNEGRVNQRGLATQIPDVVDDTAPQSTTAAAGAGQGQRIGLAGFRNTQSGMLVMLDVGGLEPGNYQVGIDDPSVLAAQPSAPVGQQPVAPPERRQTPPPPAVPPQSEDRLPNAPASRGAVPADQPSRGGQQPQSQVAQPGTTVLAQVTDGTGGTGRASGAAATQVPATGQVDEIDTPPTGRTEPLDTPATGRTQPLDTPATGRTEPLDTPPTGQARPLGAAPTGQSRANALLDEDAQGRRRGELRDERRDAAGTAFDTGFGTDVGVGFGVDGRGRAGGIPALVPVGVLTVDESGTGRLQQVVEGLQVADVVGQAIVIYSQAVQPDVTLPPNLDVGAAPQQRVPAGGQQQVGGAPGGAAPPPHADTPSERLLGTGGATPQALQAGAAPGHRPIAGGIIRMLPDRLGAEVGVPQQPAARRPATGQELR